MEKRGYTHIWQYLKAHRFASIAATHLLVIAVLGLALLTSTYGQAFVSAFAQGPCASGDTTYVVKSGDILGNIAGRYNTTWQSLASHNHIAHPSLIFVGQHICIPGGNGDKTFLTADMGNTSDMPAQAGVVGSGNLFPYAQCTWWADERYHQLHGVYVPWTFNANAWQWTTRAYENNWRVSSHPTTGAIIDLQPYVQGAYGLGHVAIVERVLSNGHVLASNMNWGGSGAGVVYFEFAPGPGVTFISL